MLWIFGVKCILVFLHLLDVGLASRIDLIVCSYVWVSYVSSVDILSCPFSDHCALFFSWVLPDSVPMSPGLWKLNLAVLQEDEFVSLITNFCFFGSVVNLLFLLSQGGGTPGKY